jgi:hypothetical protein
MHRPIENARGPRLLGVDRVGGSRWLDARYDRPGAQWHRNDGFAFVVLASRRFFVNFL